MTSRACPHVPFSHLCFHSECGILGMLGCPYMVYNDMVLAGYLEYQTSEETPSTHHGKIIFTSQVIALLPLYNALTTYEAQTGEMQINRLDQPP